MNELAQKLLKPDARITVAVYGHVSHQQAQTIGLQQYDAEKETKVNPGKDGGAVVMGVGEHDIQSSYTIVTFVCGFLSLRRLALESETQPLKVPLES